MNRDDCKHHNCDEMLNKVMKALDGGYSHEEEKKFLDDLKECSCCLETYNIEMSFKTFLCHKVRRKKVSKDLIENIKTQISANTIR